MDWQKLLFGLTKGTVQFGFVMSAPLAWGLAGHCQTL